MVSSTVEARKQQEKMEDQKREFSEKTREMESIIESLKAKNRCLEKPSPFIDMYKKSEERRKEEVAQLNREIEQLHVVTKDQEQNISSLQEVCEVMRAADAVQAERKLNVCKKTYEVGIAEIKR